MWYTVAVDAGYRMLAEKFIAKYGIETDEYDVIKGGELMLPIFI